MDLRLNGKAVLVSGGAKGIGAAIARGLAQEGAMPVVVDRDEEASKRLAAELTANGKSIVTIAAELARSEDCRRAIEETRKRCGRLDALVNNAGVNDSVGLESGSPEKFVASLERNLLHYYNLTHFALSELKRARGSIVNIASKTAVTGQGGTSGYVAAKGGILALTREWAAELAKYGIRVNAVVPAEVMTPLYEQWLAKFPNAREKRKQIEARIPLEKRMTTSEEIAAAVLFLLSEKASHMTGQHVFVDGGYTHLDRALT